MTNTLAMLGLVLLITSPIVSFFTPIGTTSWTCIELVITCLVMEFRFGKRTHSVGPVVAMPTSPHLKTTTHEHSR